MKGIMYVSWWRLDDKRTLRVTFTTHRHPHLPRGPQLVICLRLPMASTATSCVISSGSSHSLSRIWLRIKRPFTSRLMRREQTRWFRWIDIYVHSTFAAWWFNKSWWEFMGILTDELSACWTSCSVHECTLSFNSVRVIIMLAGVNGGMLMQLVGWRLVLAGGWIILIIQGYYPMVQDGSTLHQAWSSWLR